MAQATEIEKLLYTQEEAAAMLGVCLKYFKRLGIPFVKIGRRKKYSRKHLERFADDNVRQIKCQSTKDKGRRTGNTMSRSMAVDFEAALERTART